jgi:hypothetical protein
MTWLLIILLILIHSIDMELTAYYIGNNAADETFPLMSLAIEKVSIYPAIWLSRSIMYTYFWFALMNQEKKGWFYFLLLATILYWVAMADWIFQLGLAKWPFPHFMQSWN